MKTIQSVTVGDNGDPSVGINSACWQINMHSLEVEDENLELLRNEIKSLYSGWSEMGCDYCTFDFENELQNPNNLIDAQVEAYQSGFTAGRDSEIERRARFAEYQDFYELGGLAI